MYIKTTVTPNAKKETLVVKAENHLLVSVREKAERNMANSRVRELLSLHFKVPLSKVRIISGHHSHSKIFAVD